MENGVRSNTTTSWRRWFRRTNVYIAEYILMLILVGAFLGISAGLWYSFFGLLIAGDANVSLIGTEAATQIASLLIVAPAMYWLYSRVTGQEMVQPELERSKARTVFLTLWVLGVVLALVGVAISAKTAVTLNLFGVTPVEGDELWLGTVLPGLFTVATFALGLLMVVKRETRKFTMLSGWIILGVTAFLLIGNSIVLANKKDDLKQPTNCAYSVMSHDDNCAQSEYENDMRDMSESYKDYFKSEF